MKKISEIYKEQGIDFSFPIEIKDADGRQTYYEDSNGYWSKSVYGVFEIYFDSLNSRWKKEFDDDGNCTYYEDSTGFKVGIPKSQSCDSKMPEKNDYRTGVKDGRKMGYNEATKTYVEQHKFLVEKLFKKP